MYREHDKLLYQSIHRHLVGL